MPPPLRPLLAAALLLLAGASARAEGPAPAELSVLTYNTHGLPAWISRDDPEARYPLLLEKAAAYQVVLLQEDFAFHALVDADARQPLRVRGPGRAHALPGFAGAGLTLLARFPAAAPVFRGAYGVCNGWLGAANDCFAAKGFLMQRLALVDGRSLDVWNTHLDAGDADADRAARAQQLETLARAIEAQSADRAQLVGGDFNLDWDVEADRALLERFTARLGLELAAMTPVHAWRSRIDYLYYRPGGGTRLRVERGGMAPGFVGPHGEPLSDHPPIFAVFQVR